MPKLYIDFETYSEADIKKGGGYKYATHPSTQLVCLGYAFDEEPVELLTPADDLPARIVEHVLSGQKVYAHNATFDFRIWNYVCVRDFDWPALVLDQMVDTVALCQSYTLPAKLADAGPALSLSITKDTDGLRLIKLCCCPGKNKQQHTPWGVHAEAFRKLFKYCKQDVASMRAIVNKLPRQELIPIEHKVWVLTYSMNTYGLPCDIESAKVLRDYTAAYIEEELKKVPALCGGAFVTMNQLAKMKSWALSKGYAMATMDADAIRKALADPACPEEVKTILVMRQELGRTSTAKYVKLLDMACARGTSHYLHDNLQYHGAGTGRWAGRGFQVHNLPRASVRDEDLSTEENDQRVLDAIESFSTGAVVDPVSVAKALIRPMIKAPPGQLLITSDYSGIENRVLHWLADDTEALADFVLGKDQYKTMAAARYGVHYDDVTKPQRQVGKVIILGCGYGMGWKTFVETADVQFGLTVTPEEAVMAVSAYREKYHKVKALWNGLKIAAVRTVLTNEQQTFGMITFATGRVKGIRWLAMRLPSGKCIYYMEPRVEQMPIPDYEHMGPVPTITHYGVNPYSKKWSRLKLTPGRITENAVQATAREIMAQGMLNVVDCMPEVTLIATVHDEAIGLVPTSEIREDTLNTFNTHLCSVPWAAGCPIKAEGWVGARYKK